MRQFFALVIACAGGLLSLPAIALDASPAPVAVPVPSAATPASAPPPPPDVPAPVPVPVPVTATLNDDSKVEFDVDGTVWVISPDGTKNPAPDGTLTLKDGTPFLVKDGRRVDE